jgi:hypothetical protein
MMMMMIMMIIIIIIIQRTVENVRCPLILHNRQNEGYVPKIPEGLTDLNWNTNLTIHKVRCFAYQRYNNARNITCA